MYLVYSSIRPSSINLPSTSSLMSGAVIMERSMLFIFSSTSFAIFSASPLPIFASLCSDSTMRLRLKCSLRRSERHTFIRISLKKRSASWGFISFNASWILWSSRYPPSSAVLSHMYAISRFVAPISLSFSASDRNLSGTGMYRLECKPYKCLWQFRGGS